MEIKHAICPVCGVGCGIDLIVKDGKVIGTYPYRRNPINEGKNCINGKECYKIINDKNRLKTPLIRKNVEFIESNWNDTLELVSKKLKTYNPDEIAIIGSGKCTNEDNYALKKLADNLNVKNIGVCICNSPKIDLNKEIASYDDVENSKFILILGDIFGESPLIGRRVIKAKEKGSEIITVIEEKDITNNKVGELNSNKFIKINNFSEFLKNIDKEPLKRLDENSIIIFNKIIEREDVNLVYNISEKTGCKLLPLLKYCNTMGAIKILPPLNRKEMFDLIKDVKCAYIVGENPALYDKDNNILKSLDFLVVQDIFLTETAQLADVVLPSACWAEKDGTFTNTMGTTQKINKIIGAPGEALPDYEIISKLAEKMR
ncbi:molybdopterin oxidoreductase family protein [Methanothermococcus okinawensis]|nr:molybdopterin-dependent oxidoreductase [Methanothermococcus okinawensis]